ncbi:MAG TPA: hypothetical protein VFL83_14995 [Anaeromyxobacter sp.]|nr:hypothetical protein [Anaeromyxobacter sp.]
MAASRAKVLSTLPSSRQAPAVRAEPALPARRQERRASLQVLRDSVGGALLLAAWIALWTATWAAVAGPLSPAHEAPPAQASSTAAR